MTLPFRKEMLHKKAAISAMKRNALLMIHSDSSSWIFAKKTNIYGTSGMNTVSWSSMIVLTINEKKKILKKNSKKTIWMGNKERKKSSQRTVLGWMCKLKQLEMEMMEKRIKIVSKIFIIIIFCTSHLKWDNKLRVST